MIREYWSVAKPGHVWAYLDNSVENKELLDSFFRMYPATSQYLNYNKLVGATFLVPKDELDNSFKRID